MKEICKRHKNKLICTVKVLNKKKKEYIKGLKKFFVYFA